ncbi:MULTISPECIES: hypothetical protein [unclassified Pasteurella]|uniref:hypothetical protein n=1 Tax=unclassified Pasteurella TaxID=2621516 RepID=UPI0014317218|nr:hypothetical protein [Pasteurella sp. 19428wF3_WM03]
MHKEKIWVEKIGLRLVWWGLGGFGGEFYAKNENGGDWLKMGGNWFFICIKIGGV